MIQNISFSSLTTLRIGGPIKQFVPTTRVEDMLEGIRKAKEENSPYLVIGGGSNLLVSDNGFNGYVIQNYINGIFENDDIVEVGAGTDLQFLVGWTRETGFSGFEKLVGIPGTVGGAVYGNAGAYGQGISDYIVWTEVLTNDGEIKKLQKEDCEFGYRDSRFKRTKEIILRVAFAGMPKVSAEGLKELSTETIKTRLQKYPAGIACPGSFFKNVEAGGLSSEVLNKIPQDKIMYGKIPAGWLLEEVGAKGASRGGVKIAEWHGNLFMNTGRGTALDFLDLAKEYKGKVSDKFGIVLEPEVQLIGFKERTI